MEKLHLFLKNRRLEMKLSQERLAELVGVTRTSIQNWEKDPALGGYPPHRKYRAALAKALLIEPLKVDLSQNTGVAGLVSISAFSTIPSVSLNDLRLGNIKQVLAKAGDFVNLDERIDDAFAVTVLDETMSPAYEPGDLVVAQRTLYPQEDDLVIFASKIGPAVLREYHHRGTSKSGDDVFDLKAWDAETPTLTVSSKEQGEIIGVVIEHRRKVGRR